MPGSLRAIESEGILIATAACGSELYTLAQTSRKIRDNTPYLTGAGSLVMLSRSVEPVAEPTSLDLGINSLYGTGFDWHGYLVLHKAEQDWNC